MSSAALSYTSGQPRRPSTKRRGGTASSASSASSQAAEAAIRDLKGIRRRRHGEGDGGDESAFAALASHVSATVEANGMPRWTVRALVLAGVGIVLVFAVLNTLPMLTRHEFAGTATLNGRPLAGATLAFHRRVRASLGPHGGGRFLPDRRKRGPASRRLRDHGPRRDGFDADSTQLPLVRNHPAPLRDPRRPDRDAALRPGWQANRPQEPPVMHRRFAPESSLASGEA